MNDSYSVDFSGTPQPNPEDRAAVRQLMVDCFRVLAKSLLLKQEAEKDTIAILRFCEKYKGKKPENFSWEEREKITAEADKLMEVWRASIKKLKELDNEYESVRKRVNGHYGKEIMPERKYPPGVEQMYKEFLDDDESNWWKKE